MSFQRHGKFLFFFFPDRKQNIWDFVPTIFAVMKRKMSRVIVFTVSWKSNYCVVVLAIPGIGYGQVWAAHHCLSMCGPTVCMKNFIRTLQLRWRRGPQATAVMYLYAFVVTLRGHCGGCGTFLSFIHPLQYTAMFYVKYI